MSEFKLTFLIGFAMCIAAFTLPIACGALAEYALDRNHTASGSFIGGQVAE